MKISSFVIGNILLVSGLLWTGTTALAYEASAIPLSPTHTLFITTYTETLLNRDGVIPLSAKLGTEGTHDPLTASFQVAGKNKIAFSGKNLGSFILSGQPIANDGYEISEGEKMTFVLVSLISHDTPLANDVRATLTSLPILLTKNGKIDSQTIKNY